MNNITRHYCLIDNYQQFAALDPFAAERCHSLKWQCPIVQLAHYIRQLRKLKRWAGNCYSICHIVQI